MCIQIAVKKQVIEKDNVHGEVIFWEEHESRASFFWLERYSGSCQQSFYDNMGYDSDGDGVIGGLGLGGGLGLIGLGLLRLT